MDSAKMVLTEAVSPPQLLNQLDKIELISRGQFRMPVIIRAVVGGIHPFYAGITHTSDYANVLEWLFSFPVLSPSTAGEILDSYDFAIKIRNGAIKRNRGPVLISEQRGLY